MSDNEKGEKEEAPETVEEAVEKQIEAEENGESKKQGRQGAPQGYRQDARRKAPVHAGGQRDCPKAAGSPGKLCKKMKLST